MALIRQQGIGYVYQSGWAIAGDLALSALAGFALAALVLGGRDLRAGRLRFLALVSLIAAAWGLAQLMWLSLVPAYLSGRLAWLVAADLAVSALAGFGFGAAAMARARDGFGATRFALLGLVPVVQAWLFLQPSADPRPPRGALAGPRGWAVVAIGLGAAAAALAIAPFDARWDFLRGYESGPNPHDLADAMIDDLGLEGAMAVWVASTNRTARPIFAETPDRLYLGHDLDGLVLRRVSVRTSAPAATTGAEAAAARQCGSGSFYLPFIVAGATYEALSIDALAAVAFARGTSTATGDRCIRGAEDPSLCFRGRIAQHPDGYAEVPGGVDLDACTATWDTATADYAAERWGVAPDDG
ncbi:hypothetical protein HKCCE2091_15065 [Rhodobacterales bacterium HKCCE2091]|nr:hypothetical protein [Rhodobacterales bacterium HKCCE2091]